MLLGANPRASVGLMALMLLDANPRASVGLMA